MNGAKEWSGVNFCTMIYFSPFSPLCRFLSLPLSLFISQLRVDWISDLFPWPNFNFLSTVRCSLSLWQSEEEETHSSNHLLDVPLGLVQLCSNLIGDIVREHKGEKSYRTYIEKEAGSKCFISYIYHTCLSNTLYFFFQPINKQLRNLVYGVGSEFGHTFQHITATSGLLVEHWKRNSSSRHLIWLPIFLLSRPFTLINPQSFTFVLQI